MILKTGSFSWAQAQQPWFPALSHCQHFCQPANCRLNTLKIANAHTRVSFTGDLQDSWSISFAVFVTQHFASFFFTCTLNKYCCCQLNSCYLFVFLNLRSQIYLSYLCFYVRFFAYRCFMLVFAVVFVDTHFWSCIRISQTDLFSMFIILKILMLSHFHNC